MSTTPAGASRPGVQVGPTSEFSLFFHVLPGHADELRESLGKLQDTPGYRPCHGAPLFLPEPATANSVRPMRRWG